MKKVFLLLLFLLPLLAQPQANSPTGPVIDITIVDQPPVFRNCEGQGITCTTDAIKREIIQNINRNLLSPEETQGSLLMILKLIIDTEGKVVWTTAVGSSEAMRKEGIRIARGLSQFTPGKHEGQAANVILNVPLMMNFRKFSDNETFFETSYEDVDFFAYYPECSNEDKRECTSKKITNTVNHSFNISGLKEGYYKTAISFTIDNTGKIRNIIAEGPNEKFNRRGISAVENLPDLIPAMKDGTGVHTTYLLPITLRIN